MVEKLARIGLVPGEDFDSSKLRELDPKAVESAPAVAQGEQEVDAIWEQRSALLTHVRADEWENIISSAKAEMEADRKK